MKADTILATIGNTPHIRIQRLFGAGHQVWIKSERSNPGASIKDRIALAMVEAAERDGKIKPGGTLIEATAGNTGLGLALIAAQKGYRLILVIPDKMSQEKVLHVRALGAEVRLTRSDVGKGHPDYYQDIAEKLSKRDQATPVIALAAPRMSAIELITAPLLVASLLSLVWMVLRAANLIPGLPFQTEIVIVTAVWVVLFILVSAVGLYSTRRQ